MDAQIAVNEAKAYQDSARNLEEQAVLIFKAFKSIYKNAKKLKASAKNLTSIYQSLAKELERARALQASGKVIDHSYFSALKQLQQAINFQSQAEARLAQIPSFEQQACLIKQATEYLDSAFLYLVRTIKLLQKQR